MLPSKGFDTPFLDASRRAGFEIQNGIAQLEVSKFATGRIRRGGPATQVVANKP